MDHQMFREQFHNVKKILSPEEQMNIIKDSIQITDKQSLRTFSGHKSAIIVCEEIAEFIAELHKSDEIGMMEELADITASMNYIRIIFGLDTSYTGLENLPKDMNDNGDKNVLICLLCDMQQLITKYIRGYEIDRTNMTCLYLQIIEHLQFVRKSLRLSDKDFQKVCSVKMERLAINLKREGWK